MSETSKLEHSPPSSEIEIEDLVDTEDESDGISISSETGSDDEQEDSNVDEQEESDVEEIGIVKESTDDVTSHLFTMDEDGCLKKGLLKYGWGNWLKILAERNYRFHPYRSGECLQKRAEKLKLKACGKENE